MVDPPTEPRDGLGNARSRAATRPLRATAGVSEEARAESRIHALLIGVDCYLPNKLPDGSRYASLGGCVRDVERVEELLRTRFGVPASRVVKLTASNGGAKKPTEPKDRWPTYENMVAAFRRVTEAAAAGDQVYIHYSGHGARSPTSFPALKGADGLDESLVPTDIGNTETRYLRDVEIAHLLKQMSDKGLVVTVVFDSCHSGGATRGPRAPGAAVRGISSVDTTKRPTDSLVASPDELAASWEAVVGPRPAAGAPRALQTGSAWLPNSARYLLLAACRPSELANEYAFEEGGRNGALTYWLLDSLKRAGPTLTFKQVHDRVVAKVHSQFELQTPQLDGDGSRVVFGTSQEVPAYTALVMKVARNGKTMVLGAGQAHGIRKGAQFAIYPLYTTDFARSSDRVALVEVTAPDATESEARVTQVLREAPIEQGAPAVLLNPAGVRLRRKVRLIDRAVGGGAGVDVAAALQRAANAITQLGSGWVEVAASANEVPDYQLAVNEAGEFEIWDPAGAPVTNLRPPLRADTAASARALAARLVHLSKYRAVQQLDNADPTSPLARALDVELLGVQHDFTPGEQPDPIPFPDPGDTPSLRDGDWTFLRVRNASKRILNISILNLRADWGISQIFPREAGNWFWPLDPKEQVVVPLRASLPPGYAELRDVVKVFATVGTTDFRQLELPSLDQPPRARTRSAALAGAPSDPLDDLLDAVTADRPATRDVNTAAYPSHGWTTEQIEVHVAQVADD